MSANDRQVGGSHYNGGRLQHWDFVTVHGVGYLEGCASKYVIRWRTKHRYPTALRLLCALFGVELPTPSQDLEKAIHYTEKALELHKAGALYSGSTASSEEVVIFVRAQALQTFQEDEIVCDLLCKWDNFNLTRAISRLKALHAEAIARGL